MIRVIEVAMVKLNMILETFYNKERVIEIETYTKEIFDILWKMSKRLKPIIALFVPQSKAVMLQHQEQEDRVVYLKLVDCTLKAKERRILVSPALVQRVQRDPRFCATIVDRLLEEYETVVSNLVGYADVITLMQRYDSLCNLFKYAIALGGEAHMFETAQKVPDKAIQKYVQSWLVLELILTECYHQDATCMYQSDAEHRDSYFVDEKDRILFNGDMSGALGKNSASDADEILRIKKATVAKIEYIRKLRNEIKRHCLALSHSANDTVKLLFG